MRMRDWDKLMRTKVLTPGQLFMLNVVWKSIKHGDARHRNWLKRKCLELGATLDKAYLLNEDPRMDLGMDR